MSKDPKLWLAQSMKPNPKRFRCRLNRKILTKKELATLAALIPEKYQREIWKPGTMTSMAKAAGCHRNMLHWTVKHHTLILTGFPMTLGGVRRSIILHELAATKDWHAVEKKWGEAAVKTACAEFIRCYPKALEPLAAILVPRKIKSQPAAPARR